MKLSKKIKTLGYVPLVAVAMSGCMRMEVSVSEHNGGDVSEQLTEGTPEAVGVLSLLNHPQTTVEVLDLTVELDVRAATAIVNHRNGLDCVAQTEDDNLFMSLASVDSVSWVGPSALSALHYYVLNYGWVPEGDDELGTWDNVDFTVNDAEGVLAVVNTANVESLEYDVRLNSKAVDSIVARRPLHTVLELSELWHVDETTLEALKLYASGEDTSNDDCDPSVLLIDDDRTDVMNEMFRELDAKTGRLSSFNTYEISGCDTFLEHAQLEQIVLEEVAVSVGLVEMDQFGGIIGGIDSFESLLMRSVNMSVDAQLDGDRTVDEFADLLELEAKGFVSDLERGPYQLHEVWMYGENSSCREELVAALEAESRRLVVFSTSLGCF